MSVLLEIDGLTARHLAVALARHHLACSRDGISVPASLMDLFEICERTASRPLAAIGGHPVDASMVAVDHPPVDYTTAAAALGISVRTVGRWVASGRLVRAGRRITAASLAAATKGRAA